MRVKFFDLPLKPYIFGQVIEIRDAMNRCVVSVNFKDPNYMAIKGLKEVVTDASMLLTDYYTAQVKAKEMFDGASQEVKEVKETVEGTVKKVVNVIKRRGRPPKGK